MHKINLTLVIMLVLARTAPAQVISNVITTNTTANSAVITWTTDQPTSSLVNYGLTASYGTSSSMNPALTTAHSVTLDGLTSNTLYNFAAVSTSSADLTATSSNFRFATLSLAPTIANINVIYLTSTSATINWTTDQPATSLVNFGPTAAYGFSSPINSALLISHSVTVDELAPGTTYNFSVVSTGAAAVESASTNQTFTTLSASATAPNMSFVACYNVTNSIATFSWTTDIPATTALAYGTTTTLGQLSPIQTTLSTIHQVTLTGLYRGTTYYFLAESSAAGGATGYSTLSNLTTTGLVSLAPVITNVAASNLTATSATITWSTDAPSTSQVNYGTTTGYGTSSPLESSLTTNHSVTLTGLSPGSVYDFQLLSASTTGTAAFGANMSGLTLWAWGDSLTEGYGDLTGNTYPLYLTTLIGEPVNNGGIGGATSTQIAAAMLATPASFPVGNCNVIWSGANNHNQVSTVLTDIASMVNALGTPKCFLVMGDINDEASPAGSPDYNSIISTNTSLAAQYPNNYLNIRELLVQAYNPAFVLDQQSFAADMPAMSLHAARTQGTITSGPLDAASCAISVSNGTHGVGTVIIIDSETILVNAIPDNVNITACTRGYNGTAAATHVANANYSLIDPVHLGSNGYEFVARQVAAWFSSRFPLTFTTPPTDMPGPAITALTASGITTTTAVITWTTDQPSTSRVNYGATTAYGLSSTTDPTLTTAHSVTLAGLTPNSSYYFDVVSANAASRSSTSRNSAFSTIAADAPLITSVAATNLTPTTVTISWITSQPASAQVSYGTTANYGTLTAPTTTLTTSQAVALSGLTPNTTYNYQVISGYSLGASSASSNYTFTTPAASGTPPYVAYVAFWGISNNGVIISWSTDVNASTVVAYGTTPALGQFQTNISAGSTSTTSHGITLTGLTPGTRYYFVAESTSSGGATGYSATYSFTTTGSSPVNPSFSLSAAAANATSGSSATSSVLIAPQNGFNSPVTLSPSNWPNGITGNFVTNPAIATSVVNISVDASVLPGPYMLTVNGTSGALIQTTTIALTVTLAAPPSSSSSSAEFTGSDTATMGSWSGSYGADGFVIANDISNLPSYATLSFTGALSYTWASLTSDLRALQSSSNSTARIASSYYSATGFNIALSLNDGATHQVALYLLDWDTSARAETISITDSVSGTLLDSHTFSSFHNGTYVVWNIKGTVNINVSATSGNPVVSAIFLGTSGGVSTPAGFTLSASAATANVGSSGTSTVTVAPSNGFNAPVTLSASAWPAGISGTFGTNPATASSLVSINVGANVQPGTYSLTVTGTSDTLSETTTVALTVGMAQPGSGASASFAGLDTTTQGTWTGKYGAAGYLIANDAGVNPAYATVGVPCALTYTWAAQTADTRGLQNSPVSLTNIASAYTLNSGQVFTINISITDGNTHSVSLYLLDWDSSSRNQTITFLDAVTNTPLDTQTFSGFHNGQYASWNIQGNVIIKVASKSFISPVVSGIFFN